MLRRGFTLIELLVVITIIAILSGAAIPYVQDYVEEARYSKAKSDLDEIASALTRYELDRGTSYTGTSIADLVGPYLQKSLVDPWGGSYQVLNLASTVETYGPDGGDAGGDDIEVSFRPPLALSKAYWEDSDQDGAVSDTDSLILKFTRPTDGTWAPAMADLTLSNGALVLGAISWNTNNTQAKVVITTVTTAFVPGKDTITISAAGAANIVDGGGIDCKEGLPMPIKAR